MTLFEKIAEEILKGNSETTEELVNEALSSGISAESVIREERRRRSGTGETGNLVVG